MRNAKNILQHELIGLDCEVISSKNPACIGVKGRIIDETMKTVLIEASNNRKRIEKYGSKFRLSLKKTTVVVNGSSLIARPEDRIKKKVKRW